MPTTVTDLTVEQILADVPADTSSISASGTPISEAQVGQWKAEAEARAALLLRGQDMSVTLSDDARLFAGDFVKNKVIGRILRKLRLFEVAREYSDEAAALEDVLRSFEEQLDQADVGASRVNSNINTSSPKSTRFGADYEGF